MTAQGPAVTLTAAFGGTRTAPVFDSDAFTELTGMIGDDGVAEMVFIFETETRARIDRLGLGGQDTACLVREMHTLKGAAGTVACPRLATMGRALEQAARGGARPRADDLQAIAAALDDYLAAFRFHVRNR